MRKNIDTVRENWRGCPG